MTPKWIEFKLCRSRAACSECRDRIGHRCWRSAVMDEFDTPPGGVDWECPNGIPWSEDTEHAKWCERFGIPIGPSGCAVCVNARAVDPTDPELSSWFSQSMGDLGRAFGARECPNRQRTDKTEEVACCDGQTKVLPVFLCRETGQRAHCARCAKRCLLITNQPQDPTPIPPTT